MNFNIFGDIANQKLLLIHGVLTPWQIWTPQIEHFSKRYCVVVPALDAHEQEYASEFVTIEEEAVKIEKYCIEMFKNESIVVCGISMGGAIAHILWKRGKLNIASLILDGASLVPYNKFMVRIMTNQYLTIVHKSKERDAKTLENFKKQFLPEKYLKSYLGFIDHMSDSSIRNIIDSMGQSCLVVNDVSNETKVLYMYGTTLNELLSRKSAQCIVKHYPNTKIVKCKGCPHCYNAIYDPAEWVRIVEDFLDCKKQ